MLIDNHGRTINYLRLAVTDRCNLRCSYCMPAEGIAFMPRQELLPWAEMFRLVSILHRQGIDKVRITGGEPFARQGLMDFLAQLSALPIQLSITTNATLLAPHIDRLHALGIRSVNVSLDALDRARFHSITRRDCYPQVYANLRQLMARGFEVKINCIVLARPGLDRPGLDRPGLDKQNIDQIMPLVRFTEQHPVAVRFLEEMPFNGTTTSPHPTLRWDYRRILDHIQQHYPDIVPLTSAASSTSQNYRVPGHVGTFGVIPAFSRTFCGTCNRLRISARGELRTCLYGKNQLNFRAALRGESADEAVVQLLHQAVGQRAANGFVAEDRYATYESMTSIGG